MDLTWSLYEAGHRVRFVPDAVCYPIEPRSFTLMSRQLRRWSHGFVQNVWGHWRGVLEVPILRSLVGVALWDAVVASFGFLVLLPILAVLVSPLFLLAYLIDLPALLIPVLVAAIPRGEARLALASMPAFVVLRLINAAFFLEAVWTALVLRRPLTVYEKGH